MMPILVGLIDSTVDRNQLLFLANSLSHQHDPPYTDVSIWERTSDNTSETGGLYRQVVIHHSLSYADTGFLTDDGWTLVAGDSSSENVVSEDEGVEDR